MVAVPVNGSTWCLQMLVNGLPLTTTMSLYLLSNVVDRISTWLTLRPLVEFVLTEVSENR